MISDGEEKCLEDDVFLHVHISHTFSRTFTLIITVFD